MMRDGEDIGDKKEELLESCRAKKLPHLLYDLFMGMNDDIKKPLEIL